jgi:HEAT repeat protein
MELKKALIAYYEKNDKLSIPFREEDDDSAHKEPFYIKDSYRNLALLRSSTPHDSLNADRFESSLAQEQNSIYGKLCPLILDQLFVPIGEPREIKRILVSGPAGIGKSTLCHHLAYQWSQGEMFNGADGPLFDAVFWLTLKAVPLLMKNYPKLTLAQWILQSCFDEDILTNHPISENEIQKLLFDTHRTRCLLILDGFDEVSDLFAEMGSPLQKLLQTALKYDQAIVTTRPYAKATLRQLGFDREVEDVGFSDESILTFIHHYFHNEKRPEQASLLWEAIQRQPVLKRIASIPLQTYFLCFTWIGSLRDMNQANKIVLSDLYQLFTREIWVRRLPKEEQAQLDSFEAIEHRYETLLYCFSQLAHEHLTKKDPQLLIEAKQLKEFVAMYHGIKISDLTSNGFIRKDAQGNYLFIHLTVQEFFTAYYLYQQLISNSESQQAQALRFIQCNKYHARYEIVMTFLIGLAHRNPIKKKPRKDWSRKDLSEYKRRRAVEKLLWDALFVFDVDWIGVRHSQLMIRALEESGRLDNPLKPDPRDQVLVDQLADWVLASLKSPHSELAAMLRSQLVDQMAVCPLVTQRLFDQLAKRYSTTREPKDFWDTLATDQRKKLLSGYWLPLLAHLSAEYSSFLISLLIDHQQNEATASLLRGMDWTVLKKTPLRETLLKNLSQKIQQSGDELNSEIDMSRMLPVWLSLVQVGDDQEQVLARLGKHRELLLQWAVWLAAAVLNPVDKTLFLKELLFRLEEESPEQEIVLMVLSVISDWDQPRNLLIKFWWGLLNDVELSVQQRAVHRLDLLLDKTASSDDRYQQLQRILWQHRQWPAANTAQVPFREGRFALLINSVRHKDEALCLSALRTLAQCDGKQWDRAETHEIVRVLSKLNGIQNQAIRIAIVQALVSLAHQYASDVMLVLLGAIKDSHDFDGTATEALGKFVQLNASAVITVLLEATKGQDESVREAAFQALGHVGQQHASEVIPRLLLAIKDKHEIVRRAAISAFGQLGQQHPNEVIPVLWTALADQDSFVRIRADLALANFAKLYPSEMIPKLMIAIKHNHAFVRGVAARALGNVGEQHINQLIPVLLETINDRDELVRTHSAEALGHVGQQHANDVIPVLLVAIKDPYELVRSHSAKALGQIGRQHAHEVLPLLLEAIKDQDESVRRTSAEAIAEFAKHDTGEVIRMLLMAIKDGHEMVRSAVAEALGQVRQEHANDVIPVLLEAIKDGHEMVQRAAVKALGQIGQQHTNEVIPALLAAIKDTNWHLKATVSTVLAEFAKQHPSEVLPVLVQATLQDQDKLIKGIAARALGAIPQKHANELLPVLRLVITDESKTVRAAAVEALGQVARRHIREVLPVLAKAIHDEESVVRSATVKVLRQISEDHSSEVLPVLLQAIRDKELHIRIEVTEAVGRLAQNNPDEILPIFLRSIQWNELFLGHATLSPHLGHISTCSFSFFHSLMDELQHASNGHITKLFLPLIGNFGLQLTKPTLIVNSNPVPQDELVHAITQLADSQERAAISSQLQAYHRHHKEHFIEQLAECLERQLISPPEMVMVCQMLTISSMTWLSELDSWFKRKNSSEDWRFPLACLAQLLCNEGASIYFTQNQWVLCQRTEMILLDLTLGSRFMTLLLEQIKEYLQALQIPCQQAQTLLQRDLPLLLPRSKHRFFSEASLIPITYQPVCTYQKARATKSSVDCQEFCKAFFGDVRVMPSKQDDVYALWHDPITQSYKLKLPKNRPSNSPSYALAMKALFRTENEPIRAVDLSDNELTDRDVVLLCQYLSRYDHCRILKLSQNRITVDGLSTLVKTLCQKPSVKYLLLDHNWIAFGIPFCATLLEREKKLGLVNLDLSCNYIARGALINGKILADEDTLIKEFKDEVDYCQRRIMQSLILHTSDEGHQSSFLREHFSAEQCEQPFDKISLEKGCVAIMAYLDPYLNKFGTHSFMVIERIHPGYGQCQLIVADLVVDEADQIEIRVSETNPTEFLAHVGDPGKTGRRIALTDADNINTLLKEVYKTRNIRDFTEYKVIPKEQVKVNCHRQAVRWLVKALIIPKEHQDKWLHIEPKKSCVIF